MVTVQWRSGELHSGDKVLGSVHASVVSLSLDLGCWFCSMGQTPISTAMVRPGTAGT